MNTEVLKVVDLENEKDIINKAAGLIKAGELVAFPTETVYGLGANGIDPVAAGKIFTAKGRPADNPLILHISKMDKLKELTREVPDEAFKLAERFWPGPFTMVLKRSKLVPDITTGGLDTVAIRIPDHPIALALIDAADCPIAAPSGNFSGRPSPTSANHVLIDMNGKIPLIIDGGKTTIGLESTVFDLSSESPRILRPGAVTIDDIREIIPRAKDYVFTHGHVDKPMSPGLKYRHYSPKGKIILVLGDMDQMAFEIKEMSKKYQREGHKVGILASEQTFQGYTSDRLLILGDRNNPLSISNNLYNSLRAFDEMEADIILVEGLNESGLFLAVMDRLKRAAWEIRRV